MALSNKKERGRKNRKNQSSAHREWNRKNVDGFVYVDEFLMSLPNTVRSQVASKLACAMRYDAEVASLKETDDHNETNNTTIPNYNKERGRENRKNQASVSASANTNDIDEFLMLLPNNSRDVARALLQRCGAKVVQLRINESDDVNETNGTTVPRNKKKRGRKKKNNQVSTSVVESSNSSASSSGHNNNNMDDNNGKSSSVDFSSEMNQKFNNLDIVDPVASEQSKLSLKVGFATTKLPLAPITASKPSPVVAGDYNSNNNRAAVGHHASRMYTDTDGFPISDFCKRGNHFVVNGVGGKKSVINNVMGIWQQGAETGCIPSMINYASNVSEPHLALLWLLEGAIRGHPLAVNRLVNQCYAKTEQCGPFSLCMYWSKMVKNWVGIEKEKHGEFLEGAKKMKNHLHNNCNVCGNQESDLVELKTCNGCTMRFYCSKECQTTHWEEETHKNECNQLKILMKFHKPYANEIREQIMRGDDSKSIISLQKLRKKLGLTRPRKEYEEYLDLKNLDNDPDPSTSTNNDNDIYPRNNGTVYVGSTTETM
jgi:hypothetical protein